MKDCKVYQASGYLTKLVTYASDVREKYEEISGSLVQFDTPISKPLASLIADINPVQDLHGQDAPYPAGGGVNKWHLYQNGYYNASGNFVPSASIGCSDKIPVAEGTTYSFGAIKRGSLTIVLRGYYFDSNDAIVGSQIVGSNLTSTTAPTGAVSVALWFAVSDSTDTITQERCDEIGIQFSVGSTLPSAYSPYSNICPITGWTGCEVWVKDEYDTTLPATASVTFPDSAGTVYGGTYDFVSGGLKPYKEYDSYNGETLTGEWMSSIDKYVSGTTPTIGAQVVDLDAYDTTVQLTPQEINTLIGVNNIWADTGDVSVKYRTN